MTDKAVIIINGYPRSGKDTFVSYCAECNTAKVNKIRVNNLSTIDFIKNIAEQLGWNGEKNPKSRKFLSDLKKLSADFNDFPCQHTVDSIVSCDDYERSEGLDDSPNWWFINCREPEEIGKLVDDFTALCYPVKTVFIERNDHETPNCDSDSRVKEFGYNYIIENNKDLYTLKDSAETFMENMLEDVRKFYRSEDIESERD